jgi:gliding motility associated protien GldN
MKRQIIKCSLLVLLFSTLFVDASAQAAPRRGNRRGNNNPTTDQQQQNNNNNNPPANYPTNGNIPIRIDSSGLGNGLDTNFKKTLRWDGAFAPDTSNTLVPLNYEFLRKDDALFAEKVWRELDLREKMNQSFRYNSQDDNGDQKFIAVLLNAVRTGKILSFADDRFTQPLDIAGVQAAMGGGGATADTNAVTDINDPSKIVEYVVTPKSFNTNDVMKLRIKEQWVFDREASRMFVRIIGICPLKTDYFEGTKRERGVMPMFWIYYPDLRPLLASYQVYNSKNMGASRMTWEELFESRMFSSYVIKSELDNPGNKAIQAMIKDPILRLLESDNIKNRIFDYEQGLWSY